MPGARRASLALGALPLAFVVAWWAARVGLAPLAPARHWIVGTSAAGQVLPFLHLDWSWLWLVPAAAIWLRRPPSRGAAATTTALLALAQAATLAARSLARYWRGDAKAWDLAHFAHPLWRAAEGHSMLSTWHGDRPLFGDHGNFAVYLFAPLAHLPDPVAALLVAQAVLVAAWIPAAYLLGRALGLDRATALAPALVAAASRPIENAAWFDFHPECAVPLALVLALAAHRRQLPAWLVLCALVAASTRDTAALTVGMALAWLALERGPMRRATLVTSAAAFAVAAAGMFLVPRLTGWPVYLDIATGPSVDWAVAAKTTFLRAATTLLLPWLHPFTWVAGLPWSAAAALAHKVGVKGVEFQYGFVHAPVALAGGAMLLAWLDRRGLRGVRALALVWALGTVAVNASRHVDLAGVAEAREHRAYVRGFLRRAGAEPSRLAVAADNCTAPFLVEHEVLVPVCYIRLDLVTLDVPVERALEADRIVVRRDCGHHGDCVLRQVGRAIERGYRVAANDGTLLVLAR